MVRGRPCPSHGDARRYQDRAQHPPAAACRLPRTAADHVFPASRGGAETILHFKKFWPRIAKLGGLPADITPHALRHSFTSLAADLGYSEPTIAALVGHKGRSITSRYVHSADAVLLAAADAVARRTAELMGEQQPQADVVPLRASRLHFDRGG
jgi:integrase